MLPFTKAVGTSRLAVAFLDAAKRQPLDEEPQSLVTYFLLGHALELAWKSVLISGGISDRELRDIGHDLLRAKNQAEALIRSNHACQQYVDEITDMIANYYSTKAFEYLTTGYASLPQAVAAITAVEEYVQSIVGSVDRTVRLRTLHGDSSE